MSEQHFIIKEHLVPCQHIREEFITSSPDDPAWQMQVKQYTPRNNSSPKEGDITILSSHANGFPRELYEPFWDDLLYTLTAKGLKIRTIFIVTPSHLSPSSVNPGLIQDGSREPDTSRDLLLLVNHFQDTILHPIIGVGHSIGASQLISLSLMHPSLFTSLVLIEPVIGTPFSCDVFKLATAALKRRREWKSRAEAENYFAKAWRNWDTRVRERWNASALVPSEKGKLDGKVELAWDRLQELVCYMDMSELRASADQESGFEVESDKGSAAWTPYPPQLWDRLRDLGVHAFFVCGEESAQSPEESRRYWKAVTGTNEKFWMRGFKRKVELLEMKSVGHLVPLEAPGKCAEITGERINDEIKVWWEEWEKNRRWRQMSEETKGKAVETWITGLKSRI